VTPQLGRFLVGNEAACQELAPSGIPAQRVQFIPSDPPYTFEGGMSQYVSIKYTERLAEAGVEPSVGRVGDSYDNALAETINGLYKAEVIHRRRPWRSFEAVEFATLEWVDWFNYRRLLEPIGKIPPAEAEQATTPCWSNPTWRRNSNQMASEEGGSVQFDGQ
jgi:hypothetical protein